MLVEFYLMADSSTTAGRIPILCSGGFGLVTSYTRV